MTRVALALALLAAACKPSPAPEPALGGFDERQDCSADRDCVVVEVECCDQCNGGLAVGVHRDYAAEVRRDYQQGERCKGAACTEMACPPPKPICRQQRCGVMIGNKEQLEPLPRL